MLQIILMLLGLAFSENNTSTFDNNQNPGQTTNDTGSGTDTGGPGGTSGNTGQTPPTVIPPRP